MTAIIHTMQKNAGGPQCVEREGGQLMSALILNSVAQGPPGRETERVGNL